MCNNNSNAVSKTSPLIVDSLDLFLPQKELLERGYVESDDNWLIATPTGSGKTLMAEWSIQRALLWGGKAAYVAPLKAILEEKENEWSAKYPEVNLGVFTGDRDRSNQKPSDRDLMLFTPEKLAGYFYRWKKNIEWISRLNAVIFDEFHLLGEASRGPSLEALISRLRRVNPFAKIIGLSATMPNYEELASWLGATAFVSDWRPVPIKYRVLRFKKVAQKFDLLLSEILENREHGGKTLVFVNSRKRSETLATRLMENGVVADFNHAGLDLKRRSATQNAMRKGALDVVVSTSTLEMGVNFPARKVVIYDSYGFDGESFSPLSVQRYLQCSGRAGRPGFDDYGESVILQPVWDRVDYLNTKPAPLRSGFFANESLEKEVLNEVASRLSISIKHLETNFANLTLWRRQDGTLNMEIPVLRLLGAGLLKWSGEGETYLSETALGRIAAQLGVCPHTISLLRAAYRAFPIFTEFDLLVISCLAKEGTPKFGFNFEEIDQMANLVLEVPSHFLDAPTSFLSGLGLSDSGKKALSAVKCAVMLFRYTQGATLQELAEEFDCYPNDLDVLRRNVSWVLEAAERVFSVLRHEDNDEKVPDEKAEETDFRKMPEIVCSDLKLMIEYGIPRESLSLIRIKDIGTRRARLLMQAGISTSEQVVQVCDSCLSRILHVKSRKVIGRITDSARKVVERLGAGYFSQLQTEAMRNEAGKIKDNTEQTSLQNWPSSIDPYRLRRALELKVDHVSLDCVRISGGTEPHTVTIHHITKMAKTYRCDCLDFAKGQSNCKHVVRTRLELRDDADLLALLRRLQAKEDRPLRYSLGDLWMQAGREYDFYCDRQVDYAGRKFLDRAKTQERWNR